MKEVKSSTIEKIGHVGTTLTVKFRDTKKKDGTIRPGPTWSYHDVPEHIHRDLMAADSVGGYFGSFVKNKFKGHKHEG